MSNTIQTTTIIRQRGQLTIPDAIRKIRSWAKKDSVVVVSSTDPDEIVIRPYEKKKEVNWDLLWKKIEEVRSYRGKGSGNLSKFIIEDRETRR